MRTVRTRTDCVVLNQLYIPTTGGDDAMNTELSDDAWKLLMLLNQESVGGPKAPTSPDWAQAYSELVEKGFVQARTITPAGAEAVTAHFLRMKGGRPH